MYGSYTGYMIRQARERAEKDKQTVLNLHEAASVLLAENVPLYVGIAQITSIETNGYDAVTVHSNGASVTYHVQSMGFYNLQQQVRKLLQEGTDE